MKKICVLIVALLFIMAGCVNKNPKEIKLSFDKTTAYFTSQTSIAPIEGEIPTEADKVEKAIVTIKAQNAERVQLLAVFKEGQEVISCLKILVDGEVKDFSDGVVLYEGSIGEECERSFEVVIYLAKDAPLTEAGKTLAFDFVLNAV